MLFHYLHLVSALSFVSFYFSDVIGAGHITEANGYWFREDDFLFSLAFALVSAVVWWLHWRWIFRMGEFKSKAAKGAHKLYLVTIAVWMAFSTLVSGAITLNVILRGLSLVYFPPWGGYALAGIF